MNTISEPFFITFLYPLILLALGFLLSRGPVRLDHRTIAALCVFVMIPSYYFLQAMRQNTVNADFYFLFFFYFFHTATLYLLTKGIFHLTEYPAEYQKVSLFTILVSSTFGLRILQSFLTSTIQSVPIIYIIAFFQSLILASLGIYLISKETRITHRLINMWKTPLLYAVLGGILLAPFQTQLPFAIIETIGKISAAAIPVTLLLIGVAVGNTIYFLDFKNYASHIPGVLFCTAFRLILSPLLALGLVVLMGMNDVGLVRSILIAAGFPTGLFAGVLACYYGKKEYTLFVLLTIVFTTVGSFITLPLWLLLVNKIYPAA